MAALEAEVAEYLEDEGIGTVGTDIRFGQLSDAPVNQVSVMIAPDGRSPSHDSIAKQWLVSVAVRNEGYSAAQTKIEAVYTALHDQTDILALIAGGVNVVTYSRAIQRPTFLGRGPNLDSMWSCEFRLYGK